MKSVSQKYNQEPVPPPQPPSQLGRSQNQFYSQAHHLHGSKMAAGMLGIIACRLSGIQGRRGSVSFEILFYNERPFPEAPQHIFPMLSKTRPRVYL